jgi:hypothetical protein
MSNMEVLYNWLFHYNPYTQVWSAFRREDKEKYFNGELLDYQYHQSKKIMDLIGFVAKHGE